MVLGEKEDETRKMNPTMNFILRNIEHQPQPKDVRKKKLNLWIFGAIGCLQMKCEDSGG